MIFRLLNFTLVLIVLSFSCCNNSKSSITEFNSWLNEPSNGCILSKNINGYSVSVKYLPPSYLILKNIQKEELGSNQARVIDSLLNLQSKVMTFIMTIKPQKERRYNRRGSIMDENVETHGDYVQRVVSMNFSVEQYLNLYTSTVFCVPISAFVENLYELSESRSFVITFPKEKGIYGEENVTFMFDDPYLNMGKLQFHFDSEKLMNAEKLKID